MPATAIVLKAIAYETTSIRDTVRCLPVIEGF
jgi:hypothetical protein